MMSNRIACTLGENRYRLVATVSYENCPFQTLVYHDGETYRVTGSLYATSKTAYRVTNVLLDNLDENLGIVTIMMNNPTDNERVEIMDAFNEWDKQLSEGDEE